jgi:hypothetical protein
MPRSCVPFPHRKNRRARTRTHSPVAPNKIPLCPCCKMKILSRRPPNVLCAPSIRKPFRNWAWRLTMSGRSVDEGNLCAREQQQLRPPASLPTGPRSISRQQQRTNLSMARPLHSSILQTESRRGRRKVARVSSRDQKVGLGAALSSQPQAFSAGKELPDGVLTPDTGREEA